MGSKADFYRGHGNDAVWIGSVERDGYPDIIPAEILIQVNGVMFEELVVEFLQSRRPNSYIASEGDRWPWLWENSQMTDFTYAFFNNKVHVGHFGQVMDPVRIVQGDDMITSQISTQPLRLPNMASKFIRLMKEIEYGSEIT